MRDVIKHKDLGIMTNDIISEEKLEPHKATAYILKLYSGEKKLKIDDD